MGIVTVVVTSLHHLDIVLGNGRFLGEFLTQEIGNEVQVAVEEPANQTQRKHVATLQNGFVVHATFCQTRFHHSGERALDDTIGIYMEFAEIVGSGKLCFLQVLWTE